MLFIPRLGRNFDLAASWGISAMVEKDWAERLRQQTPTHDRANIQERSI